MVLYEASMTATTLALALPSLSTSASSRSGLLKAFLGKALFFMPLLISVNINLPPILQSGTTQTQSSLQLTLLVQCPLLLQIETHVLDENIVGTGMLARVVLSPHAATCINAHYATVSTLLFIALAVPLLGQLLLLPLPLQASQVPRFRALPAPHTKGSWLSYSSFLTFLLVLHIVNLLCSRTQRPLTHFGVPHTHYPNFLNHSSLSLLVTVHFPLVQTQSLTFGSSPLSHLAYGHTQL